MSDLVSDVLSCNASHLELARKLEQSVQKRLEQTPEPTENGLRCLAAVAEAAQRIARLALGVSTENINTSEDPYAKMTDEQPAAELASAHSFCLAQFGSCLDSR